MTGWLEPIIMHLAGVRKWHLIKLFTILNMLFLGACSSAPPAQVADRDQPPTRKSRSQRGAE